VLQRLIAAVLAVLGVAAIALGVASATVWRADDPLVATAAPGGGTRTLVTDPGVLEVAGDPVTITVRAEGSPVVLAVGRDTDVTAWVGADPYERVTGLSDWHTLATTAGEPAPGATPTPTPTADAAATAEPSPSASAAEAETAAQAADPTGSDMWVAQVTGDGSATLEWPAQDGRWSLLAVSLGDLSWPQTVTTPWLWPGVALGVLLLAVAAVLLVRILRQRREGPDAGWHPVTTGQIAVVAPADAAAADTTAMPAGAIPVTTISATGAPLTRRQIREAEAAAAAAAAAARRRGRRPATGAVPVVTGAVLAVTGTVPAVPAETGPAAERATGGESPAGTGPERGAREPRSAGAPTPTPTRGTGAPTSATGSSGGAPTTAGPAVPGATAPGATAPRTATPAAPGSDAPVPPGAPAAAPVTPPTTPAPGTPTPSTPAPAAPPATGRPEQDRPRGGLASRLPWRRGRAETPETPPRDAPPPATPAPATAWSPTPGVPATPSAPPRAAVPGTGAAPLAGESEADAAAQAGRADAWRRMWGFPEEGGTAPDGDQKRTEEDR
jgi:hypothetical protein